MGTREETELSGKSGKFLAVLNKITKSGFDVCYRNAKSIAFQPDHGVIPLIQMIHGKAVDEAMFSGVYARLCCCLSMEEITSFHLDHVHKSTVLLCMRMFNDSLQWTTDDDSWSDKEFSRMSLTSRLRTGHLGNIQYIGHLYSQQPSWFDLETMIRKLMDKNSEHSIDCLHKLLSVVGKILDGCSDDPIVIREGFLDSVFSYLSIIQADTKVSARLRFLLLDLKELRDNAWQPRARLSTFTAIDGRDSSFHSIRRAR